VGGRFAGWLWSAVGCNLGVLIWTRTALRFKDVAFTKCPDDCDVESLAISSPSGAKSGCVSAEGICDGSRCQDSLEEVIAQTTGGSIQPRAEECIITLAWFTRNRFFPLREGSTWKEAATASRKSAIERDFLRTSARYRWKAELEMLTKSSVVSADLT